MRSDRRSGSSRVLDRNLNNRLLDAHDARHGPSSQHGRSGFGPNCSRMAIRVAQSSLVLSLLQDVSKRERTPVATLPHWYREAMRAASAS